MSIYPAFGYLAATLTCAAFAVRSMRVLRMLALAGNITFIIYGTGLGLTPVWVLHMILLPLNGWRLLCAR